MGGAGSKDGGSRASYLDLGPLLYETQGFAKWTVEDVRKLHWIFKNMVHGLSLVEPQLEGIMAFKRESMGDVSLSSVFRVLDNDNDGRIDALEFMGGLTLICRGTFEEKARLCFELFDFNLNSDLSQSELVMMMQSTVCGMICLTGGLEEMEPDLDEVERLAEEAFQIADTDKNRSINYKEFVSWARSNRDVMSCMESVEKINVQSSINNEDTEDSAEEGSDVEDEGIAAEGVPEERSALREAVNKDQLNAEACLGGSISGSEKHEGGGGDVVGDQFMAVKAFLGAIFEPTDYKRHVDNCKLPDSNLEIEWVHGYRGFDSRNNLRYITCNKQVLPGSRQPGDNNNDASSSSSSSRCIVYPSAALGVVYDMECNTQRFYHGHTDDVISLALHPGGSIVATGQIGRDPVIHVWDSVGMRCLSSISGFHQRGICLLAFSDDGSRLSSVGLDNDHSVAVHDWETGKLVASGIGHQNKVLGLACSPSGVIVIVGVKFVRFLRVEGRALKASAGVLGSQGTIQTFCSVAFIGEDAVVGTASGHLYRFEGRNLVQVVAAHGTNEPVLSLHAVSPDKKHLLSGGRDGLVVRWDSQLKPVGSPIDMTDTAGRNKTTDGVITADAAVVSVHLVHGGGGEYVLAGTRGGQIIEVQVGSGGRGNNNAGGGGGGGNNRGAPLKSRVLVNSHSGGELWGLDTHPAKGEYATAGEDKTLRTWSVRRLCQLAIRALPHPARAVAYSPCGTHLAVGMTNGAVAVLDEGLSLVITSWQHSKKIISDIKYAPNSSTLAVASHDCNIYLYSVDVANKKYARRAICTGHSSKVTHIDFSRDSTYLMSNSGDYELLFWQSSGNIYRFASKLRDLPWATWTSTLGWPVQGIWPPEADGTDVNTVDRDLKLGVLATGDDAGRIKLFRYPCVEKGAMYQCYRGHSSHVTKVRFTNDHRFLVSAGGGDKCIIQWRHELEDLDSSDDEEEGQQQHAGGPPAASGGLLAAASSTRASRQAAALDATDLVHVDALSVHRTPFQDAVNSAKTTTELMELASSGNGRGNGGSGPAAEGGGDEFMAVKPWLGALVPPNSTAGAAGGGQQAPQAFETSTDVDLQLQWVHGYRSQDCRNNVRYTSSGDILYMAAALGVVYHKNKETQSFLQGAHTDDIVSLAVHPNGKLVATGEVGRKPKIIVWDVETKDVKAVLDGFLKRGVSLLSFDKTGDLVAGVGLDDDHSIAVYQWSQKRLIASGPSSKDKVFGLSFLSVPTAVLAAADPGSSSSNKAAKQGVGGGGGCMDLVTCGINHVKFWNPNGRNLNCQKGVFGGKAKQTMLSAEELGGLVFTGAANGSIYVWRGYKLQYVCEGGSESPHASSVLAMHACISPLPSGGGHNGEAMVLVTGDKTGLVAVWVLDHDTSRMDRLSLWPSTAAASNNSDGGVGQVRAKAIDLSRIKGSAPPPMDAAVRSVCLHKGHLVVGTASSEIYEAKLTAGGSSSSSNEGGGATTLEWACRARGHYSGELWGLAVHPKTGVFATGGDDGTVRFWHVDKRLPDQDKGLRVFHPQLPSSSASSSSSASAEDKSSSSSGSKAAPTSNSAAAAKGGGVDSIKIRSLMFRPPYGDHLAICFYSGHLQVWEVDPRTGLPPPTDGQQQQPKVIATRRNTDRWIQEAKYSFEGTLLAVGSHDRNIILYHAADGSYRLLQKVTRHSSYITHIDFGVNFDYDRSKRELPPNRYLVDYTDGKLINPITKEKRSVDVSKELVMQTTCGAYELLFWTADSSSSKKQQQQDGGGGSSSSPPPPMMKPEPSASKLRDACWATWTSTLGWPVQGIWAKGSDGTDINSVDRSHTYDKVPVLATADDFGRLQLFPYPCVSQKCFDKTYRGHSSHATNIRFTHDDGHLISTGGNDNCVFVWKTDCIEEAREVELARSREDDVGGDDGGDDGGADDVTAGRKKKKQAGDGSSAEHHQSERDHHPKKKRNPVHEMRQAANAEFHEALKDEDITLKLLDPAAGTATSGGDEFMATKPWKGAIREPSTWTNNNQAAPTGPPAAVLEPNHVYGYRSQDVRSNLAYTGNGVSEFVYHSAAIGIVYNSVTHKQRYSLTHTDDIISLAAYPKGSLVATGELGKIPKIVVWDLNSGNTLKIISGFHRRGVASLAFSDSGRFLASIGLDDDHSLAIYSIEKETLVAKDKVDRGKTLALAFGSDTELVASGVGFIKFFTLSEKSGELKSKKGTLKNPKEAVVAIIFLGSDVITGSGDGSIALWKGRSPTLHREGVHRKAVNSLYACTDATAAFVSGGADGLVVLWNSAIEAVKVLDMTKVVTPPPLDPEVRSVCALQNFLLVGTKSSEILEVNALTLQVADHLRTHFKEELWGLAAHPTVCHVATVGDEGTVRVWDLLARNLIHMTSVGSKARALAYSPSGTQLAVGLYSGDLVVLSDDLTKVIAQTNICKMWMQTMAFSPDGKTLAIGSHDNCIYLLDAVNYSRRAVCRGHHAAITHLDFSSDSKVLQSNCAGYELLFWKTATGEQIKSATSVRDVSWASWTCVLGWPVQGIWEAEMDGTDINAVDKAKGGLNVLITADDKGKVKLFEYPVVEKRAQYKDYGGHSSHVTNVLFSKENRFAVSTGGADRTIIQWKFSPLGLR